MSRTPRSGADGDLSRLVYPPCKGVADLTWCTFCVGYEPSLRDGVRWSMCLATMDESGDTGMKLGRGSSSLFTIGMVLFQEDAQAEACKACIQALRVELGMKLHGEEAEFHFRDMGPEYREAFLNAVAEFPFRFYTATIAKDRLSGREWGKKEYMYRRAGVLALDQALPNMLEAKLLFDATSSKKFDWEFLRFLTKHAGYYEGAPTIKYSQRLASHKDDLVQMIDVVCGAVLANDRGDRRYYRPIRHRDGGRIVYPP